MEKRLPLPVGTILQGRYRVMRQLGHDPAATRGLLERELGLPSPSDVLAEKARIFATRYQDDD